MFSSSDSIYVSDHDFSVDENFVVRPTSPYAKTKMMADHVLYDAASAGPIRALSLRYFNPIGADPHLRRGQ